ncbi:unnamed protein product [Mytilus coruscus]|uniref:HTH CENPB-type domain-containing protein n=1 Tax=Mytilus coruscus TaxID=42192 RepID=A0A6J8CGD7_MYTCO|nr:unnamed protein product [Mytilus coruscus]
MARKKKGVTSKQGQWSMAAMKNAILAVRGGMAKKKASVLYNVPRSTLRGRLNMEDITAPPTKPPILNRTQENILIGYILKMEERGFGLTVIDIRKLAYQMANKLGIHGFSEEKKSAGYDWWIGFSERHPILSVRKPEGLSAARSSMLNPSVVATYFEKLGSVMESLGVKDKPQQLFNADESGISTVHNPEKIVGKRGKRGLYAKTSGERGENVTVLWCVNAEARVLPPIIIFKGQRVSEALKGNAPPGSEFGCSKSSFIDSDLFDKWFTNIFLKTLPPARPVLLILDGVFVLLEFIPLIKVIVIPAEAYGPSQTSVLDTTSPQTEDIPESENTDHSTPMVETPQSTPNEFAETQINTIAVVADVHAVPDRPAYPVIDAIRNQPEMTVNTVTYTNSERENFDEILVIPEVKKNQPKKKTKRITTARLLTDKNYLIEMKEKIKMKDQKETEKEEKRRNRDEKRKEKLINLLTKPKRSERTTKKTTSAKKSKKAPLEKESADDKENEKDSSLYCAFFNGYYFDDYSDDEDWIKCTKCQDWYHESCTGKFGNNLRQFK